MTSLEEPSSRDPDQQEETSRIFVSPFFGEIKIWNFSLYLLIYRPFEGSKSYQLYLHGSSILASLGDLTIDYLMVAKFAAIVQSTISSRRQQRVVLQSTNVQHGPAATSTSCSTTTSRRSCSSISSSSLQQGSAAASTFYEASSTQVSLFRPLYSGLF